MSLNAPHASGVDLLTHTTLQIDGRMPDPCIARVIQALQRVPGVLLAEVNLASANIIVAHDAAVPTKSFLEAAGASMHAEIVPDMLSAALSVNTPLRVKHVGSRWFVTFATAFATLAVVDALVPGIAHKPGCSLSSCYHFGRSFSRTQSLDVERSRRVR